MKIDQHKWTKDKGWETVRDDQVAAGAQLVFVFGGSGVLKQDQQIAELKAKYPKSHILYCSTAGEIIGTQVLDESLSVTAVAFGKTKIEVAKTSVTGANDSESSGAKLAESVPKEGLVHALVFSEGLKVNGTSLINGLKSKLPATVSVTGGLVGDGANFKETLVGLDEAPASGNVVLIGLYGPALRVGYGSLGGWDPFGPERIITKAKDNVLFELDGKPALALYKEYLGEKAKELPGSGLLFPLSLRMKTPGGEANVVRTILAVDEAAQSMTFAGDMPQGTPAQLMKANFDRIIDGAGGAASMSIEQLGSGKAALALLVSCVGRKLVLQERVEEEIEAVSHIVGAQAAIAGFYSYGEICPTAATEKQCQLHNQTMTITTLREE